MNTRSYINCLFAGQSLKCETYTAFSYRNNKISYPTSALITPVCLVGTYVHGKNNMGNFNLFKM